MQPILSSIDLSGYAADNFAAYPEAMKPIAKCFTNHVAIPGTGEANGKHVLVTTSRALDLAAHYSRLARDESALKDYNAVKGLQKGRAEFDQADDSWRGMGSLKFADEIDGKTNTLQANLEAARAALEATGIKQALEEEAHSLRRKRRRVFSEYSGDYDHDRRYDVNPYQDMRRDVADFPYIEIIFPLSFNSGTSGKDIADFGARCLALAEVLEGAGYRIALTGEAWSSGLLEINAVEKKRLTKMGVEQSPYGLISIKRLEFRGANDYGDLASFAALSSLEFYRRCLFTFGHNGAHYASGLRESARSVTDYGYGRALSERPIAAAPGQLVFSPKLVADLFRLKGNAAADMFRARILNTLSLSQAESLDAKGA